MTTLPVDVVIEILSRLPPESLLRFKSVSKSWYALINHPKFVRKHFSRSPHNNHILLKRDVMKNNDETECRLSSLEFPFSESVLDVHFPSNHEDVLQFEICGHSHGLLCLRISGNNICLWNPTTRDFYKLPPSILHLSEAPCEPGGNDSTNAVGFGYDPKSKDFKVVRVVDYMEGPGFFYPERVEIYYLSKDRWREIETLVRGRAFSAPSFEMYHQGTYYWWAIEPEEGAEIIQTFDMSEEVFGRISVPEGFVNNHMEYRSMGVLNGSIILFHYPWSGNERTFDIWEMGQQGRSGGVSWSKIFTIGPVSGIEKPLLFVSSNELLMEADEGQVILYNIRTQRFKKLPIKGQPAKFRAIFITKSLVSVKGGTNIKYRF